MNFWILTFPININARQEAEVNNTLKPVRAKSLLKNRYPCFFFSNNMRHAVTMMLLMPEARAIPDTPKYLMNKSVNNTLKTSNKTEKRAGVRVSLFAWYAWVVICIKESGGKEIAYRETTLPY